MTLIGITSDFDYKTHKTWVRKHYIQAVLAAGGLPFILPSLKPEDAPAVVGQLRGLLLTGGGDIDPFLLGEEPSPRLEEVDPVRDSFELALAGVAMKKNLPLLGICRGGQVLAVAAGGRLVQHLDEACPGRIQHFQKRAPWFASHSVQIEEGTLLHKITGKRRLKVNSLHHQAVSVVPPGFKAAAYAPDGVVESLESDTASFILGIQWHPEALVESCPDSRNIFSSFVRACR
ncbi:MAG TPA: gamma-glutamyl-gamma-aminobutyrate hydrolase family protein [Firmicutes bacterium]|nr:gamma-glutamyl-gamma-aminobutyrate hydrolase family protein [Bacillota bacterium]